MIESPVLQQRGLIVKSPGASLGMRGLARDFAHCLSGSGNDIGQSIPFVCQDWANTKAAYRFLANHRVSEADILSGHFQSTRERVAAANDLVLVLYDTTEFTYDGTDRN